MMSSTVAQLKGRPASSCWMDRIKHHATLCPSTLWLTQTEGWSLNPVSLNTVTDTKRTVAQPCVLNTVTDTNWGTVAQPCVPKHCDWHKKEDSCTTLCPQHCAWRKLRDSRSTLCPSLLTVIGTQTGGQSFNHVSPITVTGAYTKGQSLSHVSPITTEGQSLVLSTCTRKAAGPENNTVASSASQVSDNHSVSPDTLQ